MSSANPTDEEIRNADSVTLFDRNREWRKQVGPMSGIRHALRDGQVYESGYFLRIPVDSTDTTSVELWRGASTAFAALQFDQHDLGPVPRMRRLMREPFASSPQSRTPRSRL